MGEGGQIWLKCITGDLIMMIRDKNNIFERVENFHADLAWNYPSLNWLTIGQGKRDSLVSGKCHSRRKKKGSYEELHGVEDGHQIHGDILDRRLRTPLDRTIPSLIYQLTKALCHPLCPLTAPLDDWSWMTRSRSTVDDTSSPWSAAYYCCTPPPTPPPTPHWSGCHSCSVTEFQSQCSLIL